MLAKKRKTEKSKLLGYAEKVWCYRQHSLSEESRAFLKKMILQCQNEEGHSSEENEENFRVLEEWLCKNGGDIFPVTSIKENVEVFFVAILIAVAIRTFFIQSFQIPTNSMFPTYHGMTYAWLENKESCSGWWPKIKQKLNLQKPILVKTPVSGEVRIPLMRVRMDGEERYGVPYRWSEGRRGREKKRLYVLEVDGTEVLVEVPGNFSLDHVLLDAFCDGAHSFKELFEKNATLPGRTDFFWLKTGKKVEAHAPLLSFVILPGDMLFVDKISCHFRRPKVGEAVVFRTDGIEAFKDHPKFLIKRLVGREGDVLTYQDGQLKSAPLLQAASPIVKKINDHTPGYEHGYEAGGLLKDHLTVPSGSCMMLGDHSQESFDSRFFGFVPEKNIFGRPLCLFFPWNRIQKCQ